MRRFDLSSSMLVFMLLAPEGGSGGNGGGDHGVDPPGGQGGAAPGAAGAAGDVAAGTDAGKTLPIGGADGAQAGTYKPEGIDAALLGQTDKDTIDNLLKVNKGFRDAQAKAEKPPEQPDAYKFEWSDRVKGYGAIAEDDAVLGKFREIALEHDYTQKQIDAIPKIFDFMAEKGMIEQPFDTSGLLKGLAPEGFRGSPEEIEAKGGERLLAAENWIKQLTPENGFDDGMKTEMRLLTTTPAGVKVIEQMMKGGVTHSVSPGGQQPQAVSKSEWEARVADPRNDAFGSRFDPAYAEETRQLAKKLFPDEQ